MNSLRQAATFMKSQAKVYYLYSSWQKGLGAMFKKALKDILVFPFPVSAPRKFHTFFCPPLRIVALDDRGHSVFDKIIEKWQIVKLPPCRIVLEMAPTMDYRRRLPDILSEVFAGGE